MALTDNLQGRWKMEEASGSLADEQGNNTLSVGGAPTYQQSGGAPQGSYSILYDGVDDNHYSGTNPPGLVITGNLSIQAWIKRNGTNSYKTYAGRWNGGSNYCYSLEITDAHKVRFRVSSNGTAITDCVGATALNDLTWYHVVGVYNGTDLRLYINGSLDSNGSENPKSYTSGIYGSTNARFRIGSGEYNGASEWRFNGYIDEVAVWDRALSASEVSDLYNNGFAQTYYQTLTETFNLSDTLAKKPGKIFTEILNLADSVLKKPTKVIAESIVLNDVLSKIGNFHRTLTETLTLTDTTAKKTMKKIVDTLSLVDTIIKKPKKALIDTLSLADSIFKKPKKIFTESLSLADSIAKKTSKVLSEILTLTDSLNKKIFKRLTEVFNIADIVPFKYWLNKGKGATNWTESGKGTTSWTEKSKGSTSWEEKEK